MRSIQFSRTLLSLLSVFAMTVGCQKTTTSETKSPPGTHAHADGSVHKDSPEGSGGHAHGEGPHGGTLSDWGGGKYHVEFTVDHDQHETTVYVLGGDEKTATAIKTPDGKLLLTITDPAFQVELAAQPMDGEAQGTASRFVGKHDKLGVVQEFAGTISGEVEGTPYAGDFKEEPHGEHDHK